MSDHPTEVLIAAAGSKRKVALLRLSAVGALVAGALILVLFVIEQGGERAATSPNALSGSGVTESAEEFSDSTAANDQVLAAISFYETKLSSRLKALNNLPVFGEKSAQIAERIDTDIARYESSPSADLGRDILQSLLQAEEVVTEHSQAADSVFQRLDAAFDALNTVAFVRFLEDATQLAPNDVRSVAWQDSKIAVLTYFSAAKQAEKFRVENDLRGELQALEAVQTTGYGSTETIQRIAVIRGQIAAASYESRISEARQNLIAQRYEAALIAVSKALQIFPSKQQALDLKAEITSKQEGDISAQWLARARREGAADQWSQAQESFKKALAADPGNQAASAGYSRASRILRYQSLLQDFYDRPVRLSDPNVIAFARSTLAESLELSSYSPKLDALIVQVEQLINEKVVPRELWVASDGKARIRVKGVGFIEPTKGKSVRLKPGTYDFYAECTGHKTQIYSVNIPVEGEVMSVRVVCGEAI